MPKANKKAGKQAGKKTAALKKGPVFNELKNEVLILRQISAITAKDFDLNAILDKFLEMVMTATDSDAGSMLLADKHTGTLKFEVVKGSKSEKLKNYTMRIGEGIAGWCAEKGKPVLTPDVSKDKRFQPKISKELNYRTRNILCVPLKFEDETLGVVELINKKKGGNYGKEDMNVMLSFAPYISAIIKNAQLILENKQKIHRLEHLAEMTGYANSTLRLDEILERILEISTDLLDAEAASVLLLNAQGTELYFAAATGAKKEEIKNIKVPIGSGIAGWVAREGRPALVTDAQNDPRLFKKADKETAFKTKSIVAVPINTKARLIGVLQVLNKKKDLPFNEEDAGILQAVSNQAATAIENARLYEDLHELFLNTVTALVAAVETKDLYTKGHSDRVAGYSVDIACGLGMADSEIEQLKLAALFHDIGKIGVNESILRKPGRLTDEEFEEIKKHPVNAANIMEKIPQLNGLIPAVKYHHERYDGSGYPDGLKAAEIPYFSRIISIADTFDAMSSSRPYRQAIPVDVCASEILRCSGTQFDPGIVFKAVEVLRNKYAPEGR